ncbi:MAG: hypothetical protein ABI456_16810 [Ktedonobacteraceae bacterium]
MAQACLPLLGKRQVITGQRIDGIKGRETDDPLISMAEIGRRGMFWIVGEQERWLPATNPFHHVRSERMGILYIPIGIA